MKKTSGRVKDKCAHRTWTVPSEEASWGEGVNISVDIHYTVHIETERWSGE
jgi:hypothetical protein